MTFTPTQQELNVRFAKALGWRLKRCEHHKTNTWHSPEGICADGNCESVLPNYFAPENFHLVRVAVGALDELEQNKIMEELAFICGASIHSNPVEFTLRIFLSPVEHIITAYLKVKEAN